jgi:hypothetical protein
MQRDEVNAYAKAKPEDGGSDCIAESLKQYARLNLYRITNKVE